MPKRKNRYVLQSLLAVIMALFLTLAVYMLLCCVYRGNPGAILAISGGFLLLLCGIAYGFFRVGVVQIRRNEQLMELYATGYTIEDVGRLDCYFSKGTELALKKTVELLDTGKLLNLSKRQAQYLALQNQINPHFLYNTLEGIRSEAVMAGLDVVADMTESLAKFFRYTVSKVESLVSVSDELDNIRTYFAIQQFRFKDRLHLVIDCPADEQAILNCRLPKLTLQPVVENAIIHGLERKVGDGTVRICLTLTANRLIIQVSDDGVGMQSAQLDALTEALSKTTYDYITSPGADKGGIALQNVNNRIRLLFGEEYGIVLHSVANMGTDVIITLPADGGRSRHREAGR